MRDAVLDLLLGGRCAVCGHPGAALCGPCRSTLPREAATCWPTPRPAGLVRPTAVGEYDGPLKLLVNAHKEQQRFALAAPLGELLAVAARAHVDTPSTRVLLVPVPSRRAVVRRRGHDPLLRLTRAAASALRRQGVRAGVGRPLQSARAVRDQAGLGATDRAWNLAGSMVAVRAAGRLVPAGSAVVIVDDVITTGATLREAQRALEAGGVEVHGIAVVAATRRTSLRASLPFCRPGD